MENSTDNPQNTEHNKHPKPTDDVQMEIETVIPENEKEGLPNNQEHNHRSDQSTDKADDQPEIDDEEASDKESGDKRDDVETTSV